MSGRIVKKYFFLLFFVVAGQSGIAQSGHIKFEHLTEKDGLPSRDGSQEVDINFVQQDDQGYVWISTPDGLVRYNAINSGSTRSGLTRINMFTTMPYMA